MLKKSDLHNEDRWPPSQPTRRSDLPYFLLDNIGGFNFRFFRNINSSNNGFAMLIRKSFALVDGSIWVHFGLFCVLQVLLKLKCVRLSCYAIQPVILA